jgi:transposase
MWGFTVFFLYALRRFNCKDCGIKTELIPWAQKGSTLTKPYQLFLSNWAKKLSWKENAEAFASTWYKVHSSVKSIVEYGLKNRDLSEVTSIGIDEVQWRCGHNYITLVYQIDNTRKRLLHVANKRTVKSLLSFFRMMGDQRNSQIQYVCSDMWKPYLKVIRKKIPQALHILDRFHIVANLNKAVNEVRAAEARKMNQEGYEDVLKHTKYCFLKNPENLTPKQEIKLKDVLQYDLKSVRAYLLKESFQLLWNYPSPYWASWFLKKWCTRAMKSRLDPMKRFAKSMRKHEPLIMNYFKAKKKPFKRCCRRPQSKGEFDNQKSFWI